ncbi:Vacuolar transporter chaperone 2 [Wickerhamomyces ciferrii]|uniref:Vacuolar transporter chaperone 2 n=1 Tax=Wickerhamomyces ciferrii (strain ATCC 14091 / BCRC 22168 / CBS 111 / JCM 3599 / NBRC 0793 / NRRL Y-1031 F-60-10) TaxID=1206466 RepID=K0KLM6_WICCF|nr:Vacuolar transporter chaperone 2 [Wickerhamomyces ciferrii]CCH43881.1 Vacuolar transporter chaperone 2 [Wickerhamomyces ciferrii]
MLFGVRLDNEIFSPWKDHYMKYDELKKLLKESSTAPKTNKKSKGKNNDDDGVFTDRDEQIFVSGLDAELEKVYTFQSSQYNKLLKRIEKVETTVNNLDLNDATGSKDNFDWSGLQNELENILSESKELDHFARLNFTGFQKIVKKHERLHPNYTSVKALLSIRLKELPFHSEDYSPLLNRISNLYAFLRENIASTSYISTFGSQKGSASLPNGASSSSVNANIDAEFQSFKFWIHPDNLMEVKTRILRHLPVLVYSNDVNDTNQGDTYDPTISSLYFDNGSFEIYNLKLLKSNASPTLRLRWSGKLHDKPDLFLEKKVVDKSNQDEDLHEVRLKLKEKYLKDFVINGDVDEFKQKTLGRFKEMGSSDAYLESLERDIDDVDKFIKQYDLQPALRSVYTRTAFQIPGDDRVRITIDSDILFIREDSFDQDRPIRNPNEWHRTDIDRNIENPYSLLRKNEFTKFPHSVMEIKIKNTTGRKGSELNGISIPFSRKHGKWIEELTTSHLVKEVPNFSKFIQGIASLFLEDDRLDILPFWLPELEDDIRKNPNDAYEELKAKQKSTAQNKSKLTRFSSPTKQRPTNIAETEEQDEQDDADLEDHESSDEETNETTARRSKKKKKTVVNQIIPFFTGSSKLNDVDSEEEEVILPAGVQKPKTLLKQAGPVKVETKVWLANERTFNRWLTVTTMFSALTFSIYSSVSKASSQNLADLLAYIYFALTLFCGIWGYVIYNKRLTFIKLRDGKHLDAPLGPLVVALGVLGAITINFIVGFRHAASQINIMEDENLHPLIRSVNEFMFRLVGARS